MQPLNVFVQNFNNIIPNYTESRSQVIFKTLRKQLLLNKEDRKSFSSTEHNFHSIILLASNMNTSISKNP